MGSRMLHADTFCLLMNSRPSSGDKSPNRLIHLHNHTLFILIITIFILVMTPLRQGGPFAPSLSHHTRAHTHTHTHTHTRAHNTDVARHLKGLWKHAVFMSAPGRSRTVVWKLKVKWQSRAYLAQLMWRIINGISRQGIISGGIRSRRSGIWKWTPGAGAGAGGI